MANSEHIAKLQEGVNVWNTWRAQNQDIQPVLHEVSLCEANLSEANLIRAVFNETVFTNVDSTDVKGLDSYRHCGPSTINHDTLGGCLLPFSC